MYILRSLTPYAKMDFVYNKSDDVSKSGFVCLVPTQPGDVCQTTLRHKAASRWWALPEVYWMRCGVVGVWGRGC